VCAGTLLCACTTTGTNGASQGSGRFGLVPLPARRQAQQLRAQAPTLRAGQEVSAATTEWRLTGPLPTSVDAANAPQPWSTDAIEQIAQASVPGTVRTSEALRCFAREMAQYAARNEGQSPPWVNHYLSAACGLSTPGVAQVFSIRANSASTTTEALVAESREWLVEHIRPTLTNATNGASIAIARDGVKVRVVIAAREDVVTFDTVSMGSSEEAVVRGEVRGAAAQDAIVVLANTRDGGVRPCVPEQGILSPRFGVRCPASAEGAPEYVEVMHIPRGRLLGRTVATTLVGGSVEGRLSWRRPALAPLLFTDAATTRTALESVVNEQRRAIGRAPLTFTAADNDATCPLGAHTLGPLTGGGEVDVAEVAMLAMMAGWGVEGRIRGAMAGANALTTRDANALMASVLSLPSGRLSLLDPDASRGVVCAAVVDSKFVGLSYTTWQLVDESRAHDAETVWARIDAERARRGAPPLRRWSGATRSLTDAIDAIDARRVLPDDVLSSLSSAAVNESATGVRAMAFSVFAPGGSTLQIPDELLDPTLTQAQIASTWYRARGSAWAVRVLLVIAPSAGVAGAV
jgi:hypothetical protein